MDTSMAICEISSSRLTRGTSLLGLVLLFSCGQKNWHSSEVYRVGKVHLLRYVHGASGFSGFISGRIRKIGLQYAEPTFTENESPISLTASDGTGLRLVSLNASARLDGPLASTELRLRFQNPKSRVVEGRFRIRLPVSASVSHLAMKIDGRWQEAEIAEISKARESYEEFLHKGQDPMLLEKATGNEFRARIFPIPAKGYKDVRLSYSNELPSSGVYSLALKALPRIDQLKVQARVAMGSGPDKIAIFRKSEMTRVNVEPEQDFHVTGELGNLALEYKEAAVVRVYPTLPQASVPINALVIMVDTSASQAPVFSAQVQRLENLVSKLAEEFGPDMPLKVAAFDQDIATVFEGVAGGYGQAQSQALLARRPLGASDFAAALLWVGQQRQASRVLLIGDAVATAGASNLSATAKSLPDSLKRIDILLTGGISDEQAASRIVRSTRRDDGVVMREEMDDSEVVRRMGTATSSLKVSVDGADWVWPSQIEGVQNGDAVIVYAKYSDSKSVPDSVAIELAGANAIAQIALKQFDSPILERSLVQAQIARLQGRYEETAGNKERGEIRQEIVALSVQHHVLSEHTALLVMEEVPRELSEDVPRELSDGETQESWQPSPLNENSEFTERLTSGLPIPGRTFESSLSITAGAQDDGVGISFAGSSSLENQYVVDGVNTSALATGSSGYSIRSNYSDPDYLGAPGRLTIPDHRPLDFSCGRINDYAANSGQLGNYSRAGSGPQSPHERKKAETKALSGKLAEIHRLVQSGKSEDALALAMQWRNSEPGNVLALVALGESLEAAGVASLAARAYGSILDLYPSRADLRRFAAGRLARLGESGLTLAVDSARNALKQRPDHLTGYRLLAMSLLRSKNYSGAFDALETGILRKYPQGRFPGGKKVLREDIAIVAKVWISRDASVEKKVMTRLGSLGAVLASEPSLRFVLNWETDANDVDLHVIDGAGEHAYFGNPFLASGATLSHDNTNGYGPERFAASMKTGQFPYSLKVHYFSRGPMGYGMGQVEILQHDGEGEVRIESRPFVVMNDEASVDLGRLTGPLE